MLIKSRLVAATATAAISIAAYGAPQFDASLAALADSKDSRSIDLDAYLSPNASWMLGAGLGSSESPADRADVKGTSLRAMAELHSDRLGIRGYYRDFSDSNNFETDTVGLRLFTRTGGWTLSAIAESRGFDVGYTAGTLLNPTRGTAHFSGSGFGAGASYAAAGWSGYIEGIFYDYGSKLQQYVDTSIAPGILRIPRVNGLTSSFVMLNQSALDHQIALGVEHGFSRSSVRLDWVGVEDASSGANSHSVSAGYRYSLTQNTNVGVTLGITDSDFGSITFGGLSFGLHR